MNTFLRSVTALAVCECMAFLPVISNEPRQAQQSRSAEATDECKDLPCYLHKSYLELFQISPHLEFSSAEIERQRKALQNGRDSCVDTFKRHSDQYKDQLDSAQKQLKQTSAKLSDESRHDVHCRIQSLRVLQNQADVLAHHGIPIAYENLEAKLDVIAKWPAEERKIRQELADGSYLKRRWGDVKDIGFREIAPGQQNDIKTGQDAIKQMKQAGLMPPEVEDQKIQDYVRTVAQRVAAHSDLHIPLNATVLNSKEINAFALPGGYLFVERGLLEAAEDESQLAGVMAHEIAHVTARHGNKLMKRATIAGLIFQAAQVAAIIFTGGVASIGMYYALQYGFYGLGLVLDLKLLGVSREYELQADQLGIQYAWNAGYDPSGFIRFFDKMATKEGYVNGVSWFRTHPPFYQRMVDAEREIEFLGAKPEGVVQTSAFEEMKKELVQVTAKAEKELKDKPSLLAPEPSCPAPQKIEYKPGEPIEKLCSAPPATQQTGQH